MLYYIAAVFYVLVCFVLMLVVLLQQGKGGDIASAFGGGTSQAAFGARAGATVLSRATAICAVLFMLGAIVLGILGQRGPGSVIGGREAPPPPAGSAPAPPPVVPLPSMPTGGEPNAAPGGAQPAPAPAPTPAPATP